MQSRGRDGQVLQPKLARDRLSQERLATARLAKSLMVRLTSILWRSAPVSAPDRQAEQEVERLDKFLGH
jgi:hypothetical protein